MKQKSVGLTLRAFVIALALILVAGSPALPPFDGVAYAQDAEVTDLAPSPLPNGTLQLDWDEVAGADSYRLWKGEGSGTSVSWGDSAHMTINAPTTMYVDPAVTAGMTYSYVVEVYDGDTRLGWSDVENVTMPGGTQKPTAKPDVTLAPNGLTAITITWTEVAGADNYRVRYWTSGLSGWMDLAAAETGRTLTHENLTPGTQYFYIVRGQNAGGNGPYSGSPGNYDSLTLEGTTTVPVLTLTRVDRTTVDITWTSTGAGAQYDLERRKVYVANDATDATEEAWGRLPSGLLTGRSHRDGAANYVPTDAESVMYEYQVRAQASDGTTGAWSATKSVSIPKAGAILPAPTMGLSAGPVSDSIVRVTWDNVAGAEFYELQWKSGDRSYSNPIRVNRPDSGNPVYDHTNLSPSTTYMYQVRSVDINGAGDWSTAFSGTTRSTQAAAGQMPQVMGLTVTDATTNNDGDARMAKLTWNAVSDASHYEIQRYDPSTTAGWQDLATPPVDGVTRITKAEAGSPPTHNDTIDNGSAAGKTFFYVVSAVEDGVDNDVTTVVDNEMGQWSDHKSVTFKAHKPGPPTAAMGVKTSANSILVSWTAPEADTTNDSMMGLATSYTVRWRTGDSATWRSMAATGTSYHHTGLRGNTSYFYRVRAENSGGESAYVDIAENDTGGVVLGNTLTAPSGLKAEAVSDTEIKVSWTAVSGASGYEVQRFNTTNGMWGSFAGTPDADDDATDAMINDSTGLTASMTYLYRVRTKKETAVSGWSAAVRGTTNAGEQPAPTLVATSTGMSMIRLSWNEIAGATTYELQWLEGSYADTGAFDAPNLGRASVTISGTHRNYVHTGRKAGTRYSYKLRAVLAQGGETAWSSPVRQYTKPAKPALSASSAISTTVVLTWDAVSFVAEDGAAARLTDPGNYVIQRRLAVTNAWATVLTTGIDCTTTTNKCTFSDVGADLTPTELKPSTRYYYRIRATETRDTIVYTSYWDYEHQNTSNR